MTTPPVKPQYSSPEEAARIYLLPNLFTAGNMLCGFLAIKNCIEARFTTLTADGRADHYIMAVWFILFACVCDLFDGRVARATKRESLFGAEFDSIADTVSFGVAPALMACFLVIKPEATDNVTDNVQLITWLLAFIYLLCAGVRLARFNVLTNPLVPGNEKRVAGGDFVGLPSPAAAGMIASLVLVLSKIMEAEGPFEVAVQAWSWTLLPLMLIISFLMVSNVRFPSFKKLDWTARARTRGFILIIIVGAVVFRYPQYSFPAIFLGYISFSIFRHIFLLKKSEMDPAPDDDDEPVSKV